MSTAFDPNPTLGALLVGTLCGAVLFGVTTVQAYIYSTRFPDDHWMIKSTVAFIWCAEAAHMAAVSNTLYTYTVLDYGNPESLLTRPPRSIVGYIFITVTIAVAVQVFFSYRIYVLSQSRIVPMITYLLSLIRLGLGYSLFAVGNSVTSLQEFSTKWQWLGVTMWTLSAVEDVTITLTLVFLLWQQRGRAAKTTTAFIDKIILWSLETGFLTAAFSLSTVLLFHTMPNNFIWIGCSVVEARVFSNSLFASLNSRSVLREMRDATGAVSINNSQFNMRPTYGRQTAGANPMISVEVHTTHDRDSDLEINSESRLDMDKPIRY
ncbi:hypothetical protein HMN09_00136100 [Mycena chlorophos]|uniref:DUF6534 domain-containing protein n=1 Tax=Mycena chlorophos TaxID=658473 RepID=A0A8H6TP20_MYCCL|nr:hypothetical protein HMN09_00136100 [Mycena chlorophos]